MELKYTLSLHDYVQHQLYVSSKSARLIKQIKANQFWITLSFTLFAVFVFLKDEPIFSSVFLLFAIISLLFYPKYARHKHYNHYLAYYSEALSKNCNEGITLQIGNEFIVSADKNAESKIKLALIERIVEIEKYFFIRLVSNSSIIIPKENLLNVNETRTTLMGIAKNNQKEFVTELDWKW